MKKYYPPIESRNTDELILIVHSDGNWQKKAIQLAQKELEKRGFDKAKIDKRYAEIEKKEHQLWLIELAHRKTESYSTFDQIYMTFFCYRELFFDWSLKKEGYLLKHKQRKRSLFIGFGLYLLFIIWASQGAGKIEKERIQEIDRIAREDTLRLTRINWTSKYRFDESKFEKNCSSSWLLSVKKNNLEHDFNLIIYKDNKPILDIDGFAGITKNGLEMILSSVNLNKTDMVFSNYDKLFEFVVERNDTTVYWDKLKPLEITEIHNGYKYFSKAH